MGKESEMRRRSQPHTFDERLNEEKARIKAKLEAMEAGPERALLEFKLRQIEAALDFDRLLSPTANPPSKRGAE
jgi:hypothetical protein